MAWESLPDTTLECGCVRGVEENDRMERRYTFIHNHTCEKHRDSCGTCATPRSPRASDA